MKFVKCVNLINGEHVLLSMDKIKTLHRYDKDDRFVIIETDNGEDYECCLSEYYGSESFKHSIIEI